MIIFLTSRKNSKDEFWKNLFYEWQKIVKEKPTSISSENSLISTLMPIWYNSNIKINNQSVFFEDWYENGIKYVWFLGWE